MVIILAMIAVCALSFAITMLGADKQLTPWQWFQHRVLRRDVDFGDGLTLLAPEKVEKSYDDWAAAEWERWERRHPLSEFDCPACQLLASAGVHRYMMDAHRDPEARKRWRNYWRIDERKIAAIGGCRCDRKLTLHQATSSAGDQLGPWV